MARRRRAASPVDPITEQEEADHIEATSGSRRGRGRPRTRAPQDTPSSSTAPSSLQATRLDVSPERESPTWITARFTSLRVQRRFFVMRGVRTALPERGFRPDHLTDDRIRPLIDYLGWSTFAPHPTEMGSLRLAVEFYAALSTFVLSEGTDLHMRMRGTEFTFSPSIHDAFLGTPVTGVRYTMDGVPEDERQIIAHRLCTLTPPIFEPRYGTALRVACMDTPWHPLALFWFGRIRPVSHDHEMPFDLVRAIYRMARGEIVDVGMMMFYRMIDIARDDRCPITFVTTITGFLRSVGVPISDGECHYRTGHPIQIPGFLTRQQLVRASRAGRAVFTAPTGPVPQTDFILTVPRIIIPPSPPSPVTVPPEPAPATFPPPPPSPPADVHDAIRDMTDTILDRLRIIEATQARHEAALAEILERIRGMAGPSAGRWP